MVRIGKRLDSANNRLEVRKTNSQHRVNKFVVFESPRVQFGYDQIVYVEAPSGDLADAKGLEA